MKSLKPVIPQSFRNRYGSYWHEFNLEIKRISGKINRQFLHPTFPKLEDGVIHLHLGCGFVNHPKLINIDSLPAPHIHYIRAIDDLSIFADNSVDTIYTCHCLEHFPYPKIGKVLAEWFRVLKYGGVLRLSVPDFDLLLDIYRENGNNINSILNLLMGGQDYKFNFHMTAFNRSSLEQQLRHRGFKQIQEWQPGNCGLTTFDDWSGRKVLINGKPHPVSLNISKKMLLSDSD